jgi:phage protein D
MSDNKRLVPTCIIYVDGSRLNTACEGAFRSVRVTDTMNRAGICTIAFDYSDLGNENTKNFSFNSELSVHLGYKDDVQEVFNGEITGKRITLPDYGASRYSVTAHSYLQRLNHAIRNRVFENKTESQAVSDIISKYGLQAECDSFGLQKPYRQGEPQTDLELILGFAERYGRDICAVGKKVYVKERMTHKRDEIIYEWGKSLIDFRTKEDIKKQSGSVQVLGWNMMKAGGFSAKKTLEDVTQKVGGGSAWTKASRSGGKQWVHNMFDHEAADSKEAEEIALGKLRQMSFQYLRAEGSGEGNQKLSAGMEVTVKYVGKAYSGDYIAEAVIHDFSLEGGYITEFKLKRNMLDDEFVKKMSGAVSHGGQGKGANSSNNTVASQTEDEGEEEDEEEDVPEFRNLKWKKDGKKVSEALVDDDVALFCEVKNIADGETVKLMIFEQGKNRDDPIDEIEGILSDGKVEASWKVVYKEEEGSNTADEIEEKGWTVPDYYFVAEYGGVESRQSDVLFVKEWSHKQLVNGITDEPLANKKYTLSLSDGTEIKGTTDENGYMEKKHVMRFVADMKISLDDE